MRKKLEYVLEDLLYDLYDYYYPPGYPQGPPGNGYPQTSGYPGSGHRPPRTHLGEFKPQFQPENLIHGTNIISSSYAGLRISRIFDSTDCVQTV